MKKEFPLKMCCLFLTGLLISFSSCQKLGKIAGTDVDDWDPDLALAIINTKITPQELLDSFRTDGFVQVESDGSIRLVYQGNVISSTGQEISTLDDFTLPVPDSSIVAQYNFPVGNTIDIVDFKAGTLEYVLQSPANEVVSVVLQFPSATQNGQVLEETVVLNNTSSVTGSFSLAASRFNFNNSNNEFPIRYVATRQSDGQPILLTNAEVTFRDLEYSYMQGYIGNYDFNFPLDTVILDIFGNWKQGEIYFEEPKIDIIVRNSFGLPIRMNIDRLDADTYQGGLLALNAPQLQGGIDFDYPSLTEVGAVKTTTITVDNSSNLPAIIQNVPYQIYYELGAEANPDNNSSIIGHLTDTSKFEVDVNVELPLYGWADDFVVEDTFNLDLSTYEEFDALDFKLITENGFPAEARMQLYFEDASGNVLDSLIHEETPIIVAAAPVDGTGRVTEQVITTTTSSFPETRYDGIRYNAKIVRLKASFRTTDAGTSSVRIYSDYELGIKFGARGNLDVEAL
ncbi:MAG: hypothetical protein MK212_21365 [Saprospiraceae bacterium]|nr:hypothetical protein [Saprospiraceae bacterium]